MKFSLKERPRTGGREFANFLEISSNWHLAVAEASEVDDAVVFVGWCMPVPVDKIKDVQTVIVSEVTDRRSVECKHVIEDNVVIDNGSEDAVDVTELNPLDADVVGVVDTGNLYHLRHVGFS